METIWLVALSSAEESSSEWSLADSDRQRSVSTVHFLKWSSQECLSFSVCEWAAAAASSSPGSSAPVCSSAALAAKTDKLSPAAAPLRGAIINHESAPISLSIKKQTSPPVARVSEIREGKLLDDTLMSNFSEAACATLVAADQSDSAAGAGEGQRQRRVDSSCLN